MFKIDAPNLSTYLLSGIIDPAVLVKAIKKVYVGVAKEDELLQLHPSEITFDNPDLPYDDSMTVLEVIKDSLFIKSFKDAAVRIDEINEGLRLYIPTAEFGEEFKETVLVPFMKGKYSKIKREYIPTTYNHLTIRNGKFRKNLAYCILMKHPSWREEIEEYLDVVIEEDAELWDKPNPLCELLII